MDENEVARIAVDCAYKIHSKLGPGLLESVYERVMYFELSKAGLAVQRQIALPVVWENMVFDEGFRIDLIVADKVILELKSLEQIHPVHKKQLLTYLRLTNKRLGLLINFGEVLIKDGISRVANGMPS